MYNLNGEPMNENTYSSPTGGMSGNYSYNPQGNTDGNYTYNAAPSAPYPMNQMNPQGPKKSGICGILGLIFSILAFPLGWFIPILGIALAIAGVVLSIIGCSKLRAARGTGIAGLIISILALIGIIIVIVVRAINLVNDTLDNAYDPFQDAIEDLEDMEDQLNDLDDMDIDFDDDVDAEHEDYVVSHYWDEDYAEIVDIDDVVLLDESGVKITATEVVYETYSDIIYPYVNITIENNSSSDIATDTYYCAVNGVIITGYILEDVYAGQTLETDISFDSDELSYAGITSINTLSCIIELYDPETYDSIYSDEEPRDYVLDSSAAGFDLANLTTDAPFFSEAGCDIYLIGTIDEYDDGYMDFLFYIDNTSSDMLCVTFDNLYINNDEQSDLDIADIGSGHGAFFTMGADDEISVESITDAKMNIEILSSDYDILFDEEVSFLP